MRSLEMCVIILVIIVQTRNCYTYSEITEKDCCNKLGFIIYGIVMKLL